MSIRSSNKYRIWCRLFGLVVFNEWPTLLNYRAQSETKHEAAEMRTTITKNATTISETTDRTANNRHPNRRPWPQTITHPCWNLVQNFNLTLFQFHYLLSFSASTIQSSLIFHFQSGLIQIQSIVGFSSISNYLEIVSKLTVWNVRDCSN